MEEAVVIALRAVGFGAALHAAGTSLFLAVWGYGLPRSRPFVELLARRSAVVAICAAIAYQLAEPIRMVGRFNGVLNVSLQSELLRSSLGTSVSMRLLGLALIWLALARLKARASVIAIAGATLVASSFSFSGHTTDTSLRWLLGPSLVLHTLVVSFWFGALWPLHLVTSKEETVVAGRVIEQFSAAAVRVVPAIFLAGVVMSAGILPSPASLLMPYGLLLLSKIVLFCVLLGLAAVNKLRLGPSIRQGDSRAAARFCTAVLAEWALIALTVVTTAVMTGEYSPEAT